MAIRLVLLARRVALAARQTFGPRIGLLGSVGSRRDICRSAYRWRTATIRTCFRIWWPAFRTLLGCLQHGWSFADKRHRTLALLRLWGWQQSTSGRGRRMRPSDRRRPRGPLGCSIGLLRWMRVLGRESHGICVTRGVRERTMRSSMDPAENPQRPASGARRLSNDPSVPTPQCPMPLLPSVHPSARATVPAPAHAAFWLP
jgi:hypothetical protein